MAFCNSCGAPLAPGAQACAKCGAAVAGAPIPAAAVTPAPATQTSALKVVLIVVSAIVVLGVLGLATVGLIGYHFAKNSRVHRDGDHVKVETPFGTVDANNDPAQVTRDLGVDIYPGAQVLKNGSASATFGDIHTVSANFESSDSIDKVCAFYKEKFPNATSTHDVRNHCTIVANDKQNMITINLHPSGDGTKIQITNVSKNVSSAK
jgi:hypothetical protein